MGKTMRQSRRHEDRHGIEKKEEIVLCQEILRIRKARAKRDNEAREAHHARTGFYE